MACSQTISGYTRGCETSVGGVKTVYLAPYVEGTFEGSGSTYSGVSSAVTWYNYDIRKNSASFTSTLNVDSANGVNYVSTELALVFSRMQASKRAEMYALTMGDTMGVVVDCNGEWWAFGAENPLEVTAGTGETGTAKGDGNKYTLTFTDETASWLKPLTAEAIAIVKAHIHGNQ